MTGTDRSFGLAMALFRFAYRAFPRAARERDLEEAAEAFELGYAGRRAEEGLRVAWRYAGRSVVDALVTGWRVRLGLGVGPTRRSRPRPQLGVWASLAAGDVRYALRRLGRAPGFSAAVIVILSLGVGANAAVFSALKTAFLEPAPYPNADRLVFPSLTVVHPGGGETSNWSYPKYRDFRDGTPGTFAGMAAYATRSVPWTDPGEAEQVAYELVAPGYFELLGAVPAVGRFFLPEEEGAATPPGVAVLSHGAWQRRFGGDPSVVGRSITVGGERIRVVGVAGADFRALTGEPAFWVPLGHARAAMSAWTMEDREAHWFHVVARLDDGLTPEQARARVAPVGRAVALAEGPLQPGRELQVRVRSFGEVWTNQTTRTSVWLLAGGAGLVLLIAIANLGSLILARGRRQARETAVRLALGAGRGRLLRQRLVESLLLAALAGVGGLVMAAWAIDAIRVSWPSRLQTGAAADVRWIDPSALSLDPGVVAVGLGLATLAAVVFALLPTLLQDTRRLTGALKHGGGTLGHAGPRSASGRRWLVGGQFAFSLALLVIAGLLGSTLLRLHAGQKGFDPDGLLVVSYTMAGRPAASSEESLGRAHQAFRERVEALPGVERAALGTTPPLSGHPIRTRVSEVVGERVFDETEQPSIGVHSASDGYFRTLGTPLVQGRSFSRAEYHEAGPVAVINRTAAETLFPGQDPVGKRFRMGFSVEESDPPWTVIGVVEDILHDRPTSGVIPEAYVAYGAWTGQSFATLLIRTAGDPKALIPGVRAAMRELDSSVPLRRTVTGHELRRRNVADTRSLVFVLSVFAGLALLLSAAGVWAVVAQAVAERRREIGVRVALGAEASQVERLVVTQGAVPLLVGGVVGLVVAALGARYLTELLFRTDAHDPAVFVGATGVLAAIWLLASWIPARAAARVDPVEALTPE